MLLHRTPLTAPKLSAAGRSKHPCPHLPIPHLLMPSSTHALIYPCPHLPMPSSTHHPHLPMPSPTHALTYLFEAHRAVPPRHAVVVSIRRILPGGILVGSHPIVEQRPPQTQCCCCCCCSTTLTPIIVIMMIARRGGQLDVDDAMMMRMTIMITSS